MWCMEIASMERRIEFRSGPICLNSSPSFLRGFSVDSHAASLTVGSITACGSSGVFLLRLEWGLEADYAYDLYSHLM